MVIRMFEGEGIKKDWVPLSEISPNLVHAVIALEDNNFCKHSGVDWGSVFEAVSDYYKGERLRGASTISMQTAKNLYLWPGRDYLRKVIEAPPNGGRASTASKPRHGPISTNPPPG
jgi:monofunctional biosynthetic peptidoglycan transglycosylase